ncbi:unnamed protein product, partial [Chrysoparadoxa australica]
PDGDNSYYRLLIRLSSLPEDGWWQQLAMIEQLTDKAEPNSLLEPAQKGLEWGFSSKSSRPLAASEPSARKVRFRSLPLCGSSHDPSTRTSYSSPLRHEIQVQTSGIPSPVGSISPVGVLNDLSYASPMAHTSDGDTTEEGWASPVVTYQSP